MKPRAAFAQALGVHLKGARMKTILVRPLIVVCAIIVGASGPAQSQMSSATVRLRVTIGDRDPALMQIADDKIGTVTLPTGHDLGFRPHLDGRDLEIRVLQRTGGAPEQAEAWTETRVFRVSDGNAMRFEEDDLTVVMEWVGVLSAETQPDSAPQCCVTCQEVRYCACAVATACADCCTSPCCNSPSATSSVATVGTRVDVPGTCLSTQRPVARRD